MLKKSQPVNFEIDESQFNFFNLVPVVCVVFDANGDMVFANNEALDTFQVESFEELRERFLERLPSPVYNGETKSPKELSETLKKAIKDGFVHEDWTYTLPDGESRHGKLLCTKAEGKKYSYIIGFLRFLDEFDNFGLGHKRDMRRIKLMLDTTPMGCNYRNENYEMMDCNQAALALFGLDSFEEYRDNYWKFSPAFQPDGIPSLEKAPVYFDNARRDGRVIFEWMHQDMDGNPIPCEITLVYIRDYEATGKGIYISYLRDMRKLNETITMMKHLEKIATVDGLTGIYNRRHFMEVGDGVYKLAQSNGQKIVAMILDIDLFKYVNDTYGHTAGDEVIKAVAKAMQKTLRAEELFARYGGEEFVVLLSGVELTEAAQIAERLRAAVESLRVNYNGIEIKVTISIGVCAATKADKTLIGIIEKADQALYEAKDNGRNRVALYNEMGN